MSGITVPDWISRHDTWITRQVRRRPYIPAHYSISALEMPLLQVREFMEPRACCHRNAERANRMLELLQLRLNKVDNPLEYARSIRQTPPASYPAQGTR